MTSRGRVDTEKIHAMLESDPAPELLTELTSFGTLMVGDAQSRSNALDSKAASCLGWAGATLGFLLLSDFWPEARLWQTVAALLSVVLASIATIASYNALRMREWASPSQEDWFCEEEQLEPERMRAYHVVSMLRQHTDHDDQNEQKAGWLLTAQTALMMGSLLVAATILLGRLRL